MFARACRRPRQVFSKHRFHQFVFFTILLQLINDFYLGFYMVHMSKRVSIALPDSWLQQLIAHLVLFAPVLLMVRTSRPGRRACLRSYSHRSMPNHPEGCRCSSRSR